MRRLLAYLALLFGLFLAGNYWLGIVMLTLYPSDASQPLDEVWNWNLVRVEAALFTIIGAACVWGILRLTFPKTFRLRSTNASKAGASS